MSLYLRPFWEQSHVVAAFLSTVLGLERGYRYWMYSVGLILFVGLYLWQQSRRLELAEGSGTA